MSENNGSPILKKRRFFRILRLTTGIIFLILLAFYLLVLITAWI